MEKKIYFTALMPELTCQPQDFPQADTQSILRDLATLKDMIVREYADNGCYISNLREIEKQYQAEAVKRLTA